MTALLLDVLHIHAPLRARFGTGLARLAAALTAAGDVVAEARTLARAAHQRYPFFAEW